jgi:acyl-CoA synthetase (AMP-forming)/AMP-acid ligase II
VSGSQHPGRAVDRAEPEDVALLLHTSGTTSRPKLVPLTQRNVATGAHNVASTLGLTATDRCLAVMPLFHIHGLVAAVLATLSAGGTVVATTGFNAFRFFEWVETSEPTWVTAVPAMYQAVLGRASGHRDTLRAHTLRFMRSSSSALPPSLMRKLEDAFGIPVVEALGMTEASHQVASNRLPPGGRRPGSVGPAAGPDVSVFRDGRVHATGDGELVVRGSNVMSGYERNDEANATAFVDGWFRTGDLGSIDSEGYVTLTGRIKEMINRGGEKIGPREVEEVLLDHEGVDQAVVFPAPHRNLGEEVAAAVVLAPGADVGVDELRKFVREHLAAFKVPRRLLIVDEIPKGPTGKPQRLMLASAFGMTDSD